MAGLIWSHQRCGSSNLQRFLGACAGFSSAGEPFNRKSLKEDFPQFEAAGLDGLRHYVARVCAQQPVIKYIYGANSVDMDEAVATSDNIGHIVMLYRQDSEAAALSNLIARQTETYRATPDRPLGKILPRKIRARAAQMEYRRDVARLILRHSGKPHTVVSYEDLFAADANERRAKARALLGLLVPGSPVSDADFNAAYDEWLAPDRKYNSPQSYAFIENYGQLKRNFDFVA